MAGERLAFCTFPMLCLRSHVSEMRIACSGKYDHLLSDDAGQVTTAWSEPHCRRRRHCQENSVV